METEEGQASYDMSLDDIIRQAKAKRAAEEQANAGISPFFRQTPFVRPYNRKPMRQQFQPRNNSRSNYINHMAKKRVMNARRTLDLRHKLISIRATKDGLDLRWKIVAHMIAKLRQQAKRFQCRQQPFQQQLGRLGGPQQGGFVSQPRVSQSTLSQIERLVGRLPPWMKGNNVAPSAQLVPRGPPLQHNYQEGLPGPMRPNSHPLYQQGRSIGLPMYQNSFRSQQVPNGPCTAQVPYADEMPPLAYEPVVPPVRPLVGIPGHQGVYRSPHEDVIQFVIADVGDNPAPRATLTLNERFTQ